MTLTATVDSVHAKAVLTLDWTGASATIRRVDPDGRRVPVRDAEPAVLVTDTVTVDDQEAPLDVEVYYEATDSDDGTVITSTPITVPSSGQVWLKHPGRPSLNQVITPTAPPERTRELEVTAHTILGRRHPVTISGGRRRAPVGKLELRTRTLGEAGALRDLLDDGSVLLLQGPDGFDLGSTWIQPMNLSEKWLVRYLGDTYRLWSLDYVTTDRPAGLSLRGITEGTYAWAAANFESYAAALLAYPTYAEMAAAP